jgi:hypothetical protein
MNWRLGQHWGLLKLKLEQYLQVCADVQIVFR